MTDAGTEMERPRDAPELLRRLLALIDSLHQPQDLAAEQVMRFIRLPMERFADDSPKSRTLLTYGKLTHEWSYVLIWNVVDVTQLPSYGLLFQPIGNHTSRPPMTSICQLDMAQFHDALLKMGYRHVGSSRQSTPAHQYRRGPVEIDIGIVGESSETLEKISHDCVSRISIDFLERFLGPGARQ